jgi:hypothetical protein|tara:strand:+ start:3761 stop:4252 length:492 start_codon:yes stop_codon:yes gene_type:complete
MSDNEWSRPAAPPPPLFLGEKERNLVKQVNDELIEKVIGQQILYYPIDFETTNFHDLYGEAVEKSFLPPVRVYALVNFDEEGSSYLDSVGIDSVSQITVHFHKRRLTEDQDLFVREGDFILYGERYYEIVKLSSSRRLFGQVDQKFEISALCKRARKGLFDAT